MLLARVVLRNCQLAHWKLWEKFVCYFFNSYTINNCLKSEHTSVWISQHISVCDLSCSWSFQSNHLFIIYYALRKQTIKEYNTERVNRHLTTKMPNRVHIRISPLLIYRVAQSINTNCIKAYQWDKIFVNLQCQTRTIILSPDINNSMRNLICDVSHVAAIWVIQVKWYNHFLFFGFLLTIIFYTEFPISIAH